MPDWFLSAAQIVAFARDIIFLLLLLSALLVLIFLYRKLAQLLETVKRTARSTEEMVAMVSENIAKPASSNPGFAFGLGKGVAFVIGLLRRRKVG